MKMFLIDDLLILVESNIRGCLLVFYLTGVDHNQLLHGGLITGQGSIIILPKYAVVIHLVRETFR